MGFMNFLLLRPGRLGVMLVFLSLVIVAPAGAGLAVGDAVEPFSLEKSRGGAFRYPEDAKGKVVFLNFWASWCPECKVELPELVEIQEKYKDRSFALLAVNTDRKRKSADKFLKKVGLDILVLYDSEQKVIKAFSPVGVPASYLIGPTGRVEKVYIGFKEAYIEKYLADIKALLEKSAGKHATAETDEGTKGEP
jgi:thiol-disulfide isomerase/thioredoxin